MENKKFLIHYSLIVNHIERKVSDVFYNYELPQTNEGHLDVEKFEENVISDVIKSLSDLKMEHIPQAHIICISEIPMLK